MSWVPVLSVLCAIVIAVVALRHSLAARARARALEAQVRWHRKALEFAGVGVWQWDMTTYAWHWVEPFTLHGARESMVAPSGDAYFDRIHPEDRLNQLAQEQACIEGAGSLRSEYRYVMPSGEIRWIRDSGDVVRDGHGVATHMYGISVDATAEKLRALDYERRTRQDDLTGMPNRRALMEHLAEATQNARPGDGLVVGFVDLNGFKALNDRYGHQAGDDCLRRIGAAFRAACRTGDLAARFGGDEFVVVTQCRADDHAPGVQRLQRLVQQVLSEVNARLDAPSLGAATGLSRFPLDADTADALIASADAAMYTAKTGGRAVAFALPGQEPHKRPSPRDAAA